MKKILISLVLGILIGAAVVYFFLPGFMGTPKKAVSAVENSFEAVTSKLDTGGNLYLYAGTEKIVKTVDEMAAKLRKVVEKEAAKSGEPDAEGLKIFDFVYGLIKDCGLTEVSGLGVSSVTIDAETNLNHSKLVLHHYKEKGKGLIWSMTEAGPHELGELDLLPADTVVAGFADFKLNVLWQWIKEKVEATDLPKLKKGILSLEPMLNAQGFPMDKILDNFAGRAGFVLTLDKEKKGKVPLGGSVVEIPEPSIAIVFSVKDDYLFNLLQSKLPMAQKSEDKGLKMLQFQVPPMPFTFEPSVILKDNLLIFASNKGIVDAMFAAKEKGNGLAATDEFKKLSANIPKKGNNFKFIGTRLFQSIMEIQKGVLKNTFKSNGENPSMQFFDLFDKDMSFYGVLQNSEEGFLFTFNHHLDLEGLILLPVTIPAGIVAAIAIPNLLTATQKGKQKSTMGDIKSISVSIEAYILDNGEAPQGNTLAEFKDKLQPFYIRVLPLKDAWGNDFHYKHGTGDKKKEYAIASGGKDGVFNGWEQTGNYWVRDVGDFGNDIILANGTFTYGPYLKR